MERHLKNFAHEVSCLGTLRAAGLARAHVEKKLQHQLRHVLVEEWAAAAAKDKKAAAADDDDSSDDDRPPCGQSVKTIGRLGRRHSSW